MGDAHDLPVRRTVLAGIGAAGVAAALAGCGGSGSDNGGTGAQPAATTGAAPGNTDTGNGGGSTDNQDAIKVSDIPVGGGKIFDTQNVVVTQPSAGQFKAFSATCTHQGCQVASVQGSVIKCPCHGSSFSIVDGSVKLGPAPRPLPAKSATVQGDTIVVS